MKIIKIEDITTVPEDVLLVTQDTRKAPNVFPFCSDYYETLQNIQNILHNCRYYDTIGIQKSINFQDKAQKQLFDIMISYLKGIGNEN